MGKVTVRIRVQNWDDIALLAAGRRNQPPRAVETEALVDTGATALYLKSAVIRRLGLREIGESLHAFSSAPWDHELERKSPHPQPLSHPMGEGGRRPGEGRFMERSALTTSNRRETRRVFSPVDLEIQGRNIQYQVTELPDDLPNIVGQIPLEGMDWVVDMTGQKLIGNPAHGGELLHEEF